MSSRQLTGRSGTQLARRRVVARDGGHVGALVTVIQRPTHHESVLVRHLLGVALDLRDGYTDEYG